MGMARWRWVHISDILDSLMVLCLMYIIRPRTVYSIWPVRLVWLVHMVDTLAGAAGASFILTHVRLLDNSRIRQLADWQLADWTSRKLVNSQNRQLAD